MAGVSLNTSMLSEDEGAKLIDDVSQSLWRSVFDGSFQEDGERGLIFWVKPCGGE